MHATTRTWSGSRRVAELVLAMAVCTCAAQQADQANSGSKPSYLGFDRNDYPGDSSLAALRKSFRYTSYWLSPPPGEKANSWIGKRAILRQYGFGFLVLFNGRTDRELKSAASKGRNAGDLGAADGKAAAAAAEREGFARNELILLDFEEGGRLLPEQAAYIFAWIDAVRAAGARAGVYCSGIEVNDGSGTISTAGDIAAREAARTAAGGDPRKSKENRLALWIANDQCPPAPGCTLETPPFDAVLKPSIADFATVWQYAQSPWRAQFSANCRANPAADGNCYAPGLPPGASMFVDLDTSESPDPSEPPD
jgi:hypothetical protein